MRRVGRGVEMRMNDLWSSGRWPLALSRSLSLLFDASEQQTSIFAVCAGGARACVRSHFCAQAHAHLSASMPRPLTTYFAPLVGGGGAKRDFPSKDATAAVCASAKEPAPAPPPSTSLPPPAWLVGGVNGNGTGGECPAALAPTPRAFSAPSKRPRRAAPPSTSAQDGAPAAPVPAPGPPLAPPPPGPAGTRPVVRATQRDAGEAGAPSAAPAARRPPPPPRRTQAHLDLGQAGFHAAPCPACGMVYARGVDADERLHAAFHAGAVGGAGRGGGAGRAGRQRAGRGRRPRPPVLQAAARPRPPPRA